MTNVSFKRNEANIREIASKINRLIEVFAEKENLISFIEKEYAIVNIEALNSADGSLTKSSVFNIEVKNINIIAYCQANPNSKEICDTFSAFVSKFELEDLLISRYFPDYLVIKNIFSILLYGIPRNIYKNDLEYLNSLYKKYNVKF